MFLENLKNPESNCKLALISYAGRLNFGRAEPQTRFRCLRMGSREYLEHSCGLLQCLDCHDLVEKAGVRGGVLDSWRRIKSEPINVNN